MSAAREIVIPLPSKPQILKMVFNNSAYMVIEEMTGKSALELMEKPELLKKGKNLFAVLYAGSRKHHTRNPGVSEEQLGEWLDEIDPYDLTTLYGEIIKVYMSSFLPREKREEFLKQVKQAQDKQDKALKEAIAPSEKPTPA